MVPDEPCHTSRELYLTAQHLTEAMLTIRNEICVHGKRAEAPRILNADVEWGGNACVRGRQVSGIRVLEDVMSQI